MQDVLKIVLPHLFSYCGGDEDSVILTFTQLRRSGFSLEFETLFEAV